MTGNENESEADLGSAPLREKKDDLSYDSNDFPQNENSRLGNVNVVKEESEFSRSLADVEAAHKKRHSIDEGMENEGSQPLQQKTPPPKPYPFEALGPVLGPAARVVHQVVQAPDSICGQSFLGAASLMAQPHADVEIDGRQFPISLFMISVAESGERKSAVDDIALKPISDYQKMLVDCSNKEKKVFQIKHEIWKCKKAIALKEKYPDAALSQLGDEPEAPMEPHILCEEPTYEGLVHSLHVGQPSMGVFSDEGGRLIGGVGMNEENLLKTICGLSNLRDGKPITRIRRGDPGIPPLYGRRLSLHLLMQGCVFSQMQKRAVFAEQGFMSRCLLAAPESMAGTRTYQEIKPLETPELREYLRKSQELLDKKHPVENGIKNRLAPPALKLSNPAKTIWKIFYEDVETSLVPEGKYRSILATGSKAADMALRIAGVLSVFENPEEDTVSFAIMQRAIVLMRWYLDEALRIGEMGEVDREMESINRKLEWMQKQGKEVFDLRCLCQCAPRPRGVKHVRKAMAVLKDYGYLEFVGNDSWRLKS